MEEHPFLVDVHALHLLPGCTKGTPCLPFDGIALTLTLKNLPVSITHHSGEKVDHEVGLQFILSRPVVCSMRFNLRVGMDYRWSFIFTLLCIRNHRRSYFGFFVRVSLWDMAVLLLLVLFDVLLNSLSRSNSLSILIVVIVFFFFGRLNLIKLTKTFVRLAFVPGRSKLY